MSRFNNKNDYCLVANLINVIQFISFLYYDLFTSFILRTCAVERALAEYKKNIRSTFKI